MKYYLLSGGKPMNHSGSVDASTSDPSSGLLLGLLGLYD